MSEDKSHKGYAEYVVSENEFIKGDILMPKNDRFRLIQKLQKKPIPESEDNLEEVDDEEYVSIQLSSVGNLFAQQVDLFVQTDYHPSIVQFEGYEFYPQHMAVTKFYPNGSLQHMLKEIKENSESHPEWNGTMKSICAFGLISAVTHIHCIHDEKNDDFSIRYLCPENIIFDAQNCPRLIHYVFGNEDLGKTSPAYIPPELYENPDGERYDEDVWAIGMILYEILTGHPPYEGKNADQIKEAIMKGELPEFPPISEDTNHIVGIIQNCLAKNPHDRPLPYMIYRHLKDTSDELFPGTDMIYYDNYREKVEEQTLLSSNVADYTETDDYANINDSTDQNSISKDLLEKADEGDLTALVSVAKMYQRGLNGIVKNEEKAFELFMNAANQNYPSAMYYASECLRLGNGCPKNEHEAFKLMKKAAENNFEKAVSEYGCFVKDGLGTAKDVKKALQIFKRGAKKGIAKCQYYLASIYSDDDYPEFKKISKAISLYKKAAQNGFIMAYNDLGLCYNKIGRKNNDEFYFKRAINSFKKAASKNNAFGCLNLGRIYKDGEIAERNENVASEYFKKAINLFKKEASKNDDDACLNLGRIYKDGKITERNENMASEYFKKAAELNNLEGIVEYGVCLKNGIGVKKDVKAASIYYHKAADAGNKRGQHNYAKILYDGDAKVQKDILQASKYFKLAADQGVPNSMFYYAKIVINGEGGVDKNLSEGKKYLKKYIKNVPENKWIEGTKELIDTTKLIKN